jgi:hypothetical protein
MKKRKCKFINRTEWLSALVGLLAGAVAMLVGGNTFQIIYSALSYTYGNAPAPLEIGDYYNFFRGGLIFIFSGIMLTNSFKLGKSKKVSKIPYYIPFLLFAIEILLAITIREFTIMELLQRGIIPAFTALALLNLHKANWKWDMITQSA